MRVVDHHDRPAPRGDLDELGQGRDVAVHREHAVGDQELTAAGPCGLGQRHVRRADVLVREDLDLRAREPRAVDDRRVVQLIADDHVLLAQDRSDRAGVRHEAGLEHQGGIGMLEVGEAALQLLVHRHRAGDRSDGPAAGAEVSGRG